MSCTRRTHPHRTFTLETKHTQVHTHKKARGRGRHAGDDKRSVHTHTHKKARGGTWYVPTGQFVNCAEPVTSVKEPLGVMMQPVEPAAGWSHRQIDTHNQTMANKDNVTHFHSQRDNRRI